MTFTCISLLFFLNTELLFLRGRPFDLVGAGVGVVFGGKSRLPICKKKMFAHKGFKK